MVRKLRDGRPHESLEYLSLPDSVEAKTCRRCGKMIAPGDKILIEKGDGAKLTYAVAKVQIYPSDNVDMNSALAPVGPTKPGLDLITRTGDVIKGTNEFNKRIVIYSEQV